MSSPFETELAAQVTPELFDASDGFAVAGCVYTPPTGDATSGLAVIVAEDEPGLEFEGLDENQQRAALLRVQVSELATAVAEGCITVGGDEWVITKPPRQLNGMWWCRCEQTERQSLGKKRS